MQSVCIDNAVQTSNNMREINSKSRLLRENEFFMDDSQFHRKCHRHIYQMTPI